MSMDATRRIIDRGAVAISADRIVAVEEAAVIAARYTSPHTIDASGKVVMPGLIDVHAHAGHGLIKTMGMEQGDHWEEICNAAYTTGSTPEFWHAESQLAALERLQFGVTTGVSLLGGGDTIMRTDDAAYGRAHCEGVNAVGTRSVVAVGPTRPPHPRTYGSWRDGTRSDRQVSFEDQFAVSQTLLREWHGAGRIRIALLTPVLRNEHEKEMSPDDYAHAIKQTQIVRDLSREARRRLYSGRPLAGLGNACHAWESLARTHCSRTPSTSRPRRSALSPIPVRGSLTIRVQSPRSWAAVRLSS